jgi:chemotaxis protein methyltransferase WspC
MLQASVEALIKQRTGIDAAIVGSGLIRSAIERRMRAHQIPDLATYWRLLTQDPEAVQQLIEVVVVPETWFFRDRSPFQLLATHVKRLQSSHVPPLKILSVPCSTGEEPYSIAIALIQAGISPSQFQIEGIDISQKNIQQALTGIYSPFSFRNDDEDLKDAFFQPVGTTYQLTDRVKQLVKFQVGNILAPQTWPMSQCYDIIFCRNLLIYFDQATRQQVLTRLNQLLKPTGVLFVGHAESSLLLNAGWQGVRVPFSFAYQKAPPPPTKLMARSSGTRIAKSIAQVKKRQRHAPAVPIIVPPVPPITTPELAITDRLHQARQLADRGELAIAKQHCAQLLQDSPLQPEVHLLLGQIHQAQNQENMAETYFSKTLYLQPECLEALVHLARLKQNQGDRATADRLYQRIERLKKNDPK